MGVIFHVLLSVVISTVVGAGVYWIWVWRTDGVMFITPREFLIGGVPAICYFKAVILIGLVLGILTR